MRYATKYYYVLLEPSRASDLLPLSHSKRTLVMRSLSNLSRFLGLYEEWRHIIKSYGFKWKRSNPLATILNIFNNNEEDIKLWLFNVLEKLPKDAAATIAFVSLSGLRVVEACNAIHLINQLSQQGRLNDYYDEELKLLKHFAYAEVFLRGSKNVFLSFLSRDLLNLILEYKPNLRHLDLKSRLKKRGFRIRLRDLRKLHGTILENSNVPESMINLIQGRIGTGLFLKHYYRPFLKELGTRVLEAIRPLEKEILSYF